MSETFLREPELVIFDCDGVLVDSEVIFNEVLRADLAEHGLHLNVEESLALFVGGSMESVQGEVLARDIALPDNWIDLVYHKVDTRLRQGVDVVEGIPELVTLLNERKLPFCVASNGPVHKMEITLGQNNLLPYFENAVFSAYEIGSWKPEPTLFLHAAQRFSVTPESCLVIEDSVTGTTAAQRAGMPCLAYAPEGDNEKLSATGAKCFSKMNEVPALIGLV